MPQQFRINRKLAAFDDDPWDAFLVDDDERDPMPEPGDFWPDDDAQDTDANSRASFTANAREELACCH